MGYDGVCGLVSELGCWGFRLGFRLGFCVGCLVVLVMSGLRCGHFVAFAFVNCFDLKADAFELEGLRQQLD